MAQISSNFPRSAAEFRDSGFSILNFCNLLKLCWSSGFRIPQRNCGIPADFGDTSFLQLLYLFWNSGFRVPLWNCGIPADFRGTAE